MARTLGRRRTRASIRQNKPEFYPWEHYKQYHNDPYFVFLWYTGARIGEIAGLDPKEHCDECSSAILQLRASREQDAEERRID